MYMRRRRIKSAIADGATATALIAGGCGCSPNARTDRPDAGAMDESRRFGDDRRGGA
jgi:hypothetical protein